MHERACAVLVFAIVFFLPLLDSQRLVPQTLRGYRLMFGSEIIVVDFRGESMAPALMDGDIVLVLPTENLKVGDVILYRDPRYLNETWVVHRVIGLEDGRIRTKGDNNPDPDRYILTKEQIVGKVVVVFFTHSRSWGVED